MFISIVQNGSRNFTLPYLHSRSMSNQPRTNNSLNDERIQKLNLSYLAIKQELRSMGVDPDRLHNEKFEEIQLTSEEIRKAGMNKLDNQKLNQSSIRFLGI